MKHDMTTHDPAELCRRVTLAAMLVDARGYAETAQCLYDAIQAFPPSAQAFGFGPDLVMLANVRSAQAATDEPRTRLSLRQKQR